MTCTTVQVSAVGSTRRVPIASLPPSYREDNLSRAPPATVGGDERPLRAEGRRSCIADSARVVDFFVPEAARAITCDQCLRPLFADWPLF
jgi:hypothetical protein